MFTEGVGVAYPCSSSTIACGSGQHAGLSPMSPISVQWNQSMTIIEIGSPLVTYLRCDV